MPGKKKRAKKKSAKPKAKKVAKGSPGKAKAAKAASPAAPKVKAQANGKEKPKEKPKTDLAPLKKKAEEGKAAFEKVKAEADALRAKARDVEAAAKKVYAEAVAPYRDACRKAGVECEFAGGRATNVAPAVRFLVERTKGGVKVAIKDRPETEEVIPDRALKESVSREAYAYTEKHIGPKSEIGNKGGYVAGCSYVGSLSSSAGESRKAA